MYRERLSGWIKHYDFILLDTLAVEIALLLPKCYGMVWSMFFYPTCIEWER